MNFIVFNTIEFFKHSHDQTPVSWLKVSLRAYLENHSSFLKSQTNNLKNGVEQ